MQVLDLNLRLRGGQSAALGAVELNRPRQGQVRPVPGHGRQPWTLVCVWITQNATHEAAELLNRAGHRQWNGELLLSFLPGSWSDPVARAGGDAGAPAQRQVRQRTSCAPAATCTAGELAKQLAA